MQTVARLLVLPLLLIASTAFAFSTPEQASWRLRIKVGSGSELGSGTMVGPEVLVTAGHMVNFKAGVQVDLFRPDGKTAHGHSIAASNDPVDMAVVQIDSGPIADWVSVGASPAVGDTVSDFGYGHLGWLRTATGRVVSSDQHVFTSDIDIEQGDSGGGVFNSSNQLVGVTVACSGRLMTPDRQAHMGPDIATSINWISKFTNVSCGPNGCTPPGRPAPPVGVPMVPVQPYTAPPVLPVPAPISPVPAAPVPPIQQIVSPSQRDDLQDQRLDRLEGMANGLLPKIGMSPLAPLAPSAPVSPVAPQFTLPNLNLDLSAQLKPLEDRIQNNIDQQIQGIVKKLPVNDDLKNAINAQGQQIVDNLAPQLRSLISTLPAIAAPAIQQAVAAAAPGLATQFGGPIAGGAVAAIVGLVSMWLSGKKSIPQIIVQPPVVAGPVPQPAPQPATQAKFVPLDQVLGAINALAH